MTDLSIAALAVLDAYYCDVPLVGSKRLAAALRAAASQLTNAKSSDKLRAIAAELEEQ
jgi:hypothetical protein